MYRTQISNAVVGSVLAEPITVNGTLLCRKGLPISLQLKEALPRFGVKDVVLESIDDNVLDERVLNFDKLTQSTYRAMQSLRIDQIVMCAKTLVHNYIEDDQSFLLNVLLDYDEGTYQHSVNVANFAVTVGICTGLSIDELCDLAIGSLLHDIGKQSIPLSILNKPDKLTDAEREVMMEHPTIGYNILKDNTELNSSICQIVWQHHENYDGSGYPRRLGGAHSYKLARLVHICDVYEALCVKRSYKDPIPRRVVRSMMEEKSGSMFDPYLLKDFMNNIPPYIAGDTVISDGKVGIIANTEDTLNPDVYFHDRLYKLNDFEHLSEYNLDIQELTT